MIRNTAGQTIGAQMILASSGADFTGTVTVYITGDGGTQTIGSVGSGICTNEGNGYYTYEPSQAETNYSQIAFTFTGTAALTATIQLYTTAASSALTEGDFPINVDGATPLHVLRRRARTRLMESYTLPAPARPVVSVNGTAGTTTVAYRVVALNAAGHSSPGEPGSTTTAAATLTSANSISLSWAPVPGATSYEVYRTSTTGSPAVGLVASTTETSMEDIGYRFSSDQPSATNTSGLSSPFWSEGELLEYLLDGCKDLWRGIIELHEGHFTVINEGDVELEAGDTTLTGVPQDCFKIIALEPVDLDTRVNFRPKPYKSWEFQKARSSSAISDENGDTIFYDILNAGSPVTAPSIVVAPVTDTDIPIRMIYVATLDKDLTALSDNPIPGESDNALIAWCVAWARSKEREDRLPDPGQMAVYASEKASMLVALTPRQEQEEQTVDGLFDIYWGR